MSNVVPIKKLGPEEYAALVEKRRLEDEQEALEKKLEEEDRQKGNSSTH